MKIIPYLSSFFLCSCALTVVQAKEKPNVIIVFIDDFGYGDLGCYGAVSKLAQPLLQPA